MKLRQAKKIVASISGTAFKGIQFFGIELNSRADAAFSRVKRHATGRRRTKSTSKTTGFWIRQCSRYDFVKYAALTGDELLEWSEKGEVSPYAKRAAELVQLFKDE